MFAPSPKSAPWRDLSADKQELARRLLRGDLESHEPSRLEGLGFAQRLPAISHDADGRFEPFPLTDMQQAYWVGRQRSLELGNVAIHSYLEIELEDLDVARLEVAWNATIRRHDMLRAIVRPDGRQQVLPDTGEYRIATETLGSADEHAAARVRLRDRMSHEVFQTDRWPLFALVVTRSDAAGPVLHLSVDGVLLDAWSLSIVIRDCLEFYENPGRMSPELPITFRDYVAGERTLREEPAYKASLEWWRSRLETMPGPPELPIVKQPRLLRNPRFVRRSGGLDAVPWQSLKGRAAAEGVTPSSLLLTVYAQVLASWSSTRIFTVNVPRFDRQPLHPDIDAVVGEFASFTLLTCDLSRPASVLDRARASQRQTWEILEHGQVSGLELVRQRLRRFGRGAASFPVVFTGNPTLGAFRPPEIPGTLKGRIVGAVTQTPQVWLDCQAGEQDGRLSFNWDAVDELFPPGTLDAMHAAFCAALYTLAHDETALTNPCE